MIGTDALLSSYVRGLRLMSAAEAVTLYLPSGDDGGDGLFVHEGSGPQVPELADSESAVRFFRRTVKRAGPRGSAADVAGQWASEAPYCRLVRLPTVEALFLLATAEGAPSPRSGRRRTDQAPPPVGQAWLGFRFDREPAHFPSLDEPLAFPAAPLDPVADAESWSWILAVGSALAWTSRRISETLRDSVSALPGRVELQSVLERQVERARASGQPVTLVFFNPDDFAAINESLGRETGDRVIREMARRIRSLHRATDFVGRYGGAVFASVLADTGLKDGRIVAEKVRRRLSHESFLEGKLVLSFTAGVAAYGGSSTEAGDAVSEMIRLADAALGVGKREGGDRTVVWDEGIREQAPESHDRLRGIFTADVGRDYRNMALLLDTLSTFATAEEVPQLLTDVTRRIASIFKPDRIGVFRREPGGAFQLLEGVSPGGDGEVSTADWVLSREEERLAALALEKGRPRVLDANRGGGPVAGLLPMAAGSEPFGCLILEHGPEANWDSRDLHFLGVLATQLALALDRAQLAAAEREHQRQEAERMQAELENLRAALDRAELLYRSAEMEDVLALARRVAPTDATVLVTGESGTGKELLARTIHELSPRRDAALVVVDCTTIPSSLVESELFGHERGAFTGADRRTRGRLLEADGGTVLLDEVSELPLAVQGGLLRFAQERNFTPVGGQRPVSVDVRIVAATNRDLAEEVRAGRFREDLYHRLHVFRLEIPPLRKRRQDILFLARHFLNRYALAYGKPMESFSEAAERALLAYEWPGNVRELQNLVMRAVILSDGRVLRSQHLVFGDRAAVPPASAVGRGAAETGPTAGRGEDPRFPGGAGDGQELEVALGALVEKALEIDPVPPVGAWLQDELLRHADRQAGGVGRAGASLLGIPETTYRRRLAKVEDPLESVSEELRPEWTCVRETVRRLLGRSRPGGESLPDACERRLLQAMRELEVERTSTAAALLGVSPPTYRRRLEAPLDV